MKIIDHIKQLLDKVPEDWQIIDGTQLPDVVTSPVVGIWLENTGPSVRAGRAVLTITLDLVPVASENLQNDMFDMFLTLLPIIEREPTWRWSSSEIGARGADNVLTNRITTTLEIGL